MNFEKETLKNREFLKAPWDKYEKDFENFKTDQEKGFQIPDFVKKPGNNSKLIDLITFEKFPVITKNINELIMSRKSRRVFTEEEISFEKFSVLLWITNGIKSIVKKDGENIRHFRTVPSGGSRHPFETYLYVNRVEFLEKGIYRYHPDINKIELIKSGDFEKEMTEAALDQHMAGKAAVTFIWSVLPYRTEWRYSVLSMKTILIDAGHVCQNLYIGCEALGLGTCAVAAYSQEKTDKLIEVDGENEFAVYMAPVGNIK